VTISKVQLSASEPIKVVVMPAVEKTSPVAAAAPVAAPAQVVAPPLPKAEATRPVATEQAAAVATKPAPAAATVCSAAKKVTKIVTLPDGFEIVADAPLEIPRAITLGSPARLALDIDCAVNGSGSKTLKVNHNGVSAVRIGSHPGSLRVVFDLNQGAVPSYRVEKTGQGLKVIFGKSKNRTLIL